MHDESLSVNGNDYIWSQQWLKDNSSYMNQFPFIFDGSLRYNVFLKNETENGFGYWIMYIDPLMGKVIYPLNPMIPSY